MSKSTEPNPHIPSKFYLKHFKTLRVQSAVSVRVRLGEVISSAGWQRLFRLFKAWYISDLFLEDPPEQLPGLVKWQEKQEQRQEEPDALHFRFTFNPFEFLNNYHEEPERALQQLLFCNRSFSRRQTGWETDVFNFYRNNPEIITDTLKKKTKRLHINDPQTVLAVYLLNTDEEPDAAGETLQDITELLNENTGWLRITGKPGTIFKVIILRRAFLHQKENIQIFPDLFNEEILKKLIKSNTKAIKTFSGLNPALYFDFNRIMPVTDDEWSFYLSGALLDKLPQKQKDSFIRRLAAAWLLEPQKRKKAIQSLRILLGYLFSNTLDVIEKNSPGPVFFFVDPASPFLPLPVSGGRFIYELKAARMLPHSPYFTDSMIKIKCALSSRRENEPIWVSLFDLFNTQFNFTDKKLIIDWMFVSGVNGFQFELKGHDFKHLAGYLDEDSIDDATEQSYAHWFAYIHELGHFLNKGKNRSEVLVMYPLYDINTDTLSDAYQQLILSGVNFDLISPPNFSDNNNCTVNDGYIHFNHGRYKILVLPGITHISLAALKKIETFYQQGGIVIATDSLPQTSINPKNNNRLLALRRKLWVEELPLSSPMFTQNDAGGVSYYLPTAGHLPAAMQDLKDYLAVQFLTDNEQHGITYTLREEGDMVYLFFLNTNSRKEAKCTVKTRFAGRPYRWDSDISESRPYADWSVLNNNLYLKLNLNPAESVLFVIDRKKNVRIWQLLESDLDGCRIEKQDRDRIELTGWKREEGKSRILVGKGKLQEYLDYEVKTKLPVLAVSSQAWHFESAEYTGKINLGNLSNRFPSLVQSVTYSKIIILKKPYSSGHKLILHLGQVYHWCTLFVNDHFVAQKLTPPWQFDITEFLREGENKISIQVMNNFSNALAQQASDHDFRYPLQKFGLFGPVKLIPYTLFRFSI
ncbi:MAG TPA: hypothetical protein ENK44_03025 [Caldithrix abyssi]|uniref:Glycosyl hydrolases family 2 sugar binding domain-containing protein n=1 Tax=Caldithrix abyssi TaxID=187145 RepID=A0A7V4UCD1_CALAY|nr:hypothetical protein [Caldithrix abyssi]